MLGSWDYQCSFILFYYAQGWFVHGGESTNLLRSHGFLWLVAMEEERQQSKNFCCKYLE